MADNEKEALTKKSDRKTSFKVRNKYHKQFNAKSKELNVKIFN